MSYVSIQLLLSMSLLTSDFLSPHFGFSLLEATYDTDYALSGDLILSIEISDHLVRVLPLLCGILVGVEERKTPWRICETVKNESYPFILGAVPQSRSATLN